MRSFEERLSNQLEATASLATLIQPSTDQLRLDKLDKFATKLLKREFTIAFAGHFSAGKSSMINALTGESVLPTSPIPTSANIVTLQQGEMDSAIVHFHEQPSVRLTATEQEEHLQSLGKSGDVRQIDLTHAASALPPGLVLMDTPGVDSVDDAHRVSTESALHLADILFYVMDYNHVQSELNFMVTDELQAAVPELYLIVNQIDKHRDDELSFDAFRRSVHASFAEHGVVPKGIFFTSLRDPAHPHNDFTEVEQLVKQSIRDAQPKLLTSAALTLESLHQEHTRYLTRLVSETHETMAEQLNDTERQDPAKVETELARVSQQLEARQPDRWVQTFSLHRDQLLKNATLMPFELREKMRRFLESRQRDFKVGLFRSAKKTEAAQAEIAQDVLRAYQTVTASEISLHLRNLMKQSLRDLGLLQDTHIVAIDQLSLDPPLSVLESALPTGITITGESVLQFTNRVAEQTQAWFVKETNAWRELIRQELTAIFPKEQAELLQQQTSLQHKWNSVQAWQQATVALERYEHGVASPSDQQLEQARTQVSIWEEQLIQQEAAIVSFTGYESVTETTAFEVATTISEQQAVRYAPEDVARIRQHLNGLQGFEDSVAYLNDKLDRLTHQSFTIALFGAFSAGKSSFCNALLGDKVLPVSPNPTTASINRIHPVDAAHPHGVAEVTFKSEAAMLEDLNEAMVETMTFESTKQAYDTLLPRTASLTDPFLRAFLKGFPAVQSFIGTVQTVDQDAFKQYVAQEERSCFVDVIDFYYDSPLTRLGVTLVDTPGADSINARHTDVAFDYIKNADAILFVTYFNHAFARADREFLIQLGRVKDAFELDKMFFLVNAIDLAASDSERQDVLNYVASELQRFGIRSPRLYGVSSLQGLTEKQQERSDSTSGLPEFEEAFHHFLAEDLTGLAKVSLSEQTEKTVQRLERFIAATEANLLRKEERLAELSALEQQVTDRFEDNRAALIEPALKAEIHELLHHVVQRIYYRFPDFFKEAYNPVRFAQTGKGAALQDALTELLTFLRFDFEQELRVTHFRVDQWLESALIRRQQEEQQLLEQWNESFQLAPVTVSRLNEMTFDGPFEDATPYVGVKRHFRNAKAFFEKNEKEQLKEELATLTKQEALAYTATQEERLLAVASAHLDASLTAVSEHLLRQTLEQLESERATLQAQETLTPYKQAAKQIRSLTQHVTS